MHRKIFTMASFAAGTTRTIVEPWTILRAKANP